MGIPANPSGCTDHNITVSDYRLSILSYKTPVLSTAVTAIFYPPKVLSSQSFSMDFRISRLSPKIRLFITIKR